MTAPNRFPTKVGGSPPKKKSKMGTHIDLSTNLGRTSKGADAETKQKAFNDAQDSSVLPAYPVAFLVAKDVNISITNNAAEGGATGEDILNSKAISEGTRTPPRTRYATHSSKVGSKDCSAKVLSLTGSTVHQHSPPRTTGSWVVYATDILVLQTIRDDETNTDYTPFDATTLPKRKEDKKDKKSSDELEFRNEGSGRVTNANAKRKSHQFERKKE
ncbi:hypothetical protein B0H14DRAFT_2627271 [Mycena olivaceomarginata]|nr:hypothetical protein B0H14DRAFT_2627271 [Mycena olivaceomarginata]